MFSRDELESKIVEYVVGLVEADDFEDWFSVESWNVHKWGDPDLIRAVFAIEAAFSMRHFRHVPEQEFRLMLESVIRNRANSVSMYPVEIEYGRKPSKTASINCFLKAGVVA